MILSHYSLKNISATIAEIPTEEMFDLPEKVLQFGTGVLLRGLPDYFIDKANSQGIFNGRIVVVKSTDRGDTSAFEKQDGLYTICVRGLLNGKKVQENIINSSISRVLSAQQDWKEILNCAHNPEMKIIISNTTEVGIQLVHEDIHRHPPISYPAKLLAFLYERYKAFSGSKNSGMVIVPTELIVDNGKKLESIVLELAHLNGLEDPFIEWLESANHFCSSLVDRIVPGKPDAETLAKLESELGYKDELLTMSEVYSLWAIEGDDEIKKVLSFCEADEGVVITKDIDLHRELKLRMLNGTHTLSCAPAFFAGFDTVKQAMDDETISTFVADVMQNEIAPSIPYPVDIKVAHEFGNKVLDRFRNPEIKHNWISITVQVSSKMKMRCLPVLLTHYKNNDTPPELFSIGVAAYLYFMKVKKEGNAYYGERNGEKYPVQDDAAETFLQRWKKNDPQSVVSETLKDAAFWGEDLTLLNGFENAVLCKLKMIIENGVKQTIESVQSNKEVVA